MIKCNNKGYFQVKNQFLRQNELKKENESVIKADNDDIWMVEELQRVEEEEQKKQEDIFLKEVDDIFLLSTQVVPTQGGEREDIIETETQPMSRGQWNLGSVPLKYVFHNHLFQN